MSQSILNWLIKRYKLLLRLIVSVGLLWYVLAQTEISTILLSMRFVNWWWLLASFVSLFIGKILTGLRWQRLLIAHQLSIPIQLLIKSLFVGQFFNSFLPSTVGGDAVRVYDTAVYSKEVARSLTALFLDRLIGIFALVLLGIVALGIGTIISADIAAFYWLIVGSFFACLVILIVIFNPHINRQINRLLVHLQLKEIASITNKASEALLALRQQRRYLREAFFISVLLQINVVLYYYFCALALNLDIGLIYFFLFTPIVLIILLIPFSVNGIGLREGAYVFFLGMIGTGVGDAIAFSWLSFGLMLSHSLIGGVIFASRNASLRRLKIDTIKVQVDNATGEH